MPPIEQLEEDGTADKANLVSSPLTAESRAEAGALRFELVNPSDPFTFTAPSLEVAAQAVLLIGNGAYGGKSLDGGKDVPIFLFGGHDEWFKEQFGKTAEESLDARDDNALADCFESFTLGRDERSSLNDIGKRAKDYAKALRPSA